MKRVIVIMLMLFAVFSINKTQAQTPTNICDGDGICVWPGDANKNGIVNGIDYLFVAHALNTVGTPRENVSIFWTGYSSDPWGINFPNTDIDYKHADCDGNGIVEWDDMYAIADDNFDFLNVDFEGYAGTNLSPGSDLFLEFSNENPEEGETIDITIHFGKDTSPINDVIGVAFELAMDTSIIQEELTVIDAFGGWLGTPEQNLCVISKYDPLVDDAIDFAFARNDNTTASGNGPIATITITLEDVITGKKSPSQFGEIPLKFEFKNVFSMDSGGNSTGVGFEVNEVPIAGTETGTHLIDETDFAKVYPNPANDVINIELEDAYLNSVALKNVDGRLVYHSNLKNKKNHLLVNVNELPTGIYLLTIATDKGLFDKRLFIQ